jgi:MYXO-CTERM domain-containing protein
MGLADPSEVPAFGVLENAVPPTGVKDPFTGRGYGPSSFPWWGAAPFTAKATRRTLTIADVIAANGPRKPARSSGDLKLGVVLSVAANATDDQIAALEEQFEPVASSLAPAFNDATSGRGTMTLVTTRSVDDAPPGDGDDDGNATPPGAPATHTTTTSGCATSPASASSPLPWLAAGVLAALAVLTARRRARH